jgi:hypothetical protein
MRLSIMSLAGMVRTLVAVGTVRLRSMFAARLFATPLRVATVSTVSAAGSSSLVTATGEVAGASAGIGAGFAWMEVVRAIGWEPVAGDELVGGASSTTSGGALASTLGVGSVIEEVGVGSTTV